MCLFISCMFVTLACCSGLVSVKCGHRFHISSALLPCGQHCFFLSGPSAALSASPHPQSEPQAQQAPLGAPAALLLTTPLHQPSMKGSPGRKQDGAKTSQEKCSRAHGPTALFINEGSEGPEKPRAFPGSHTQQPALTLSNQSECSGRRTEVSGTDELRFSSCDGSPGIGNKAQLR